MGNGFTAMVDGAVNPVFVALAVERAGAAEVDVDQSLGVAGQRPPLRSEVPLRRPVEAQVTVAYFGAGKRTIEAAHLVEMRRRQQLSVVAVVLRRVGDQEVSLASQCDPAVIHYRAKHRRMRDDG